MPERIISEHAVRGSVLKGRGAWVMEQQPAAQKLARFIQQRRDELGISVEELARRLGWGISRTQYLQSRLKSMPEPHELDAIATILECTRGDLLRAADYLPPAENGSREQLRYGTESERVTV